MKKLILLFVSLLATAGFAQDKHACCQISATEAFARLSNDAEFTASHAAPLPYVYEGKAGKMISFKTPDGKTANAFELKPATQSTKYLLVFQEWWGLNDNIKRESEKYFTDLKDVNVVALDMYDGKVATTPEQAGKLMGEAKPERLNAIIEGAIAYAGKGARIATIGWCFGGGQSLNAALLAGKHTVGCVMFYGMPEKDVNRLQKLNSDLLGLFAMNDKWISPQVVAQFEKDMRTAGKRLTVKSYPADHAFANPSNPNFNKEAYADSYKLAANYLEERLK